MKAPKDEAPPNAVGTPRNPKAGVALDCPKAKPVLAAGACAPPLLPKPENAPVPKPPPAGGAGVLSSPSIMPSAEVLSTEVAYTSESKC